MAAMISFLTVCHASAPITVDDTAAPVMLKKMPA